MEVLIVHIQGVDAFRGPTEFGSACTGEDGFDDLLAQDHEGGQSPDAGDGRVVPAGGAEPHDQAFTSDFG